MKNPKTELLSLLFKEIKLTIRKIGNHLKIPKYSRTLVLKNTK